MVGGVLGEALAELLGWALVTGWANVIDGGVNAAALPYDGHGVEVAPDEPVLLHGA